MCHITIRKLLIIAICCAACESGEPKETYPYPDVQPDFRVYVDRFIEEAEKREYFLDYEGLTVKYASPIIVDDKIYCGYGYNRNSTFQKPVILIDPTCWDAESDDLAKEGFLFHEMGHSVLFRFHRDEVLFSGDQVSLMCGDCNQFDIYASPEDAFKREYYIDELFMAYNIYYPEWGK